MYSIHVGYDLKWVESDFAILAGREDLSDGIRLVSICNLSSCVISEEYWGEPLNRWIIKYAVTMYRKSS